jgi:dienelactone hydrolase
VTARRFVALALAVVLVAAACSSSSDSASEVETEQETSEAATEAATSTETPSATEAPTTEESLPPNDADTTTPESASGPAEPVQVEIPTSDGETLTASHTAVEGAPGVVLGHINFGSKEDWAAFAEAASEFGFSVLAIDSRGYGGSTGERNSNLDLDLAAGVDYLTQMGAPSVAIIGASMNGTATVVVGSQVEVAGIATLSAPGQFGDLDAVAAAPGVTEPALIVVAEADEPYASTAPLLAEGTGGELVIFSGSAHGTGLFDDHGPELTTMLIEFLTEVTG